MKNYDERIESILRKYDERLAKEKRRKALILRSCALGAGAAAILGIGICANALKPPQKPTAESSGIISNTTEAVTTSAESSVQTSAKSVTTQKQSTATTSVKTETATSKSTSATIGNVIVKEPDKWTKTVPVKSTPAVMTTFHTASTIQTSILSAESQTTVRTSTTASAKETGTKAIQTTAASNSTLPASVTTTLSSSEWFGVYNDDSKTTYRAAWKDNKKISASEDELGDYLGEQVLHLTYYMSPNYTDEVCKVYTVKNYSPSYVIAIQSKSDDSPKICYTNAEFKTLGELIEGTDLKNSLVLKEAYSGFIDPGESPIGTPELEDFLDVLSDTSLESLSASVMNSSCSYTIKAEIPKLGINGKILILLTPLEPEKGYISLKIFGNNCTYRVEREKIESFINLISA